MFFNDISDLVSYAAALSANLECSVEIIEHDAMIPGFRARVTVCLGNGPQARTVLVFTPNAQITDHEATFARFEAELQELLPAFGGDSSVLESCRSHIINMCLDAFTVHVTKPDLNLAASPSN